MNNDLTDITILIDRSGSMLSCKDDAQGGINTFIQQQKDAEGDAVFSLVQFDTDYEIVHNGIPIKDVPQYILQPRGMTSLLDAVGTAINKTGDRLNKMVEATRPGCVVFVIVTDGHENSSKEFTNEQVKEMIKCQQSKYNWQFTFLGADAQSFDEARQLGIKADAIATYDKQKAGKAFFAASSNVCRMRSASRCGAEVDNSYTEEERINIS